MTLPLITPVSPIDGDANVPTYSPVNVRLTQLTAEALIDESTIVMAVGGVDAIKVETFAGDGSVTAGSRIFKSLFGRTFSEADVGKTLYVKTASNVRNTGKTWITGVLSANEVYVEREALTGTVKLTAGSATVIGTGTAFLSEVAAGDWIVLNSDYSNPLYVLNVIDNSTLTLSLPSTIGYTDPDYPSGVSIRPIFHTTNTIIDWALQGFADGFNGTILPYSSGPISGYELTVYPVKLLTGTMTIPQPVELLTTGTTLSGTDTMFLSELHENANIFFPDKRSSDLPLTLGPTISSDVSITIPAYSKRNTASVAYRDADLQGLPASNVTVNVTIQALDTLGRFVTVDQLSVSQPVSTYTFTTATRPKINTVDPQVANPFGLGVRVLFSENLLGYSAGSVTAIKDVNSYSVVSLDPMVPSPSVTSVVVPSGNPSYVDVMLDQAMTNGKPYKLSVKNLGIQATSLAKLAEYPYDQIEYQGYGPLEAIELIKDTVVQTVDISGPSIVDFQNPPATYEIHNLDVDVVAIQLGPQALNVEIVPNSFVNNLDGTGTFQIQFSDSSISFKVSIEVIDDVDNISDESNVLGVTARAETVPGTSLTIRPSFPVHKETCDRLIADIPQGTFYLRAGYVMPYHYDEVPFTVNVIERGKPLSIVVTREGPTAAPVSMQQSHIPQNLTETVMLRLGRGRNLIYVTDGTRHDFIIVSATTYATVLCAIAEQIYSFSQIDIDEIQNSIFSPLSSRLAEPYIPFPELLPTPSVKSQQTMALKLAVRAYVSDSGTERAVRDLSNAISMQTSYVADLTNRKVKFQPSIERLNSTQEAFGGSEFHTWHHNDCLNRWDAFVRHIANSPERMRPVRISEDEIVYEDQTNNLRRHSFDFRNPACSSLSSAINCFDNIQVRMTFFGDFVIPTCAAMYPFDSCFTNYNPLGSGRSTFDSVLPWDGGGVLDYDLLDPGDDGWVGLCWADRWDSGILVSAQDQGEIQAASDIFNDASNTLSTFAINNVATTLNVADTTGFASSGVLLVDSEQIYYSGFTPTSFTGLVRGYNGTTAASHGGGSQVFHAFSSADVGRWINIRSGSRPGMHRILNVLGPQSVRLDWSFDVNESSLVWDLLRDVHPLDSMGPAPATPMIALFGDGSTISGSDVFGSTGYAFSSVDIGRSISLLNSDDGPISIIVLEVLSASLVRIGRMTQTGPVAFLFSQTQTGIDWELWDPTPPQCIWNGYAVKAVALASSDMSLNVASTITTTLDGDATVMDTYFAGTGAQTHVHQVGGIDNVVGTIPVNTIKTGVPTTLSSAINNLVVTIPVVSTNGFPTAGVIQIDSEQISYTGVTGTDFTGATRGYNGTVAASHLINAEVIRVFPPTGVVMIGSEIITYTGNTATSFTGATRGTNGSTAASHDGGIWTTLTAGINNLVTTIPVASTGTGVSSNVAGSNVNAGDTTITVASTAGFPASGVFHLESERIAYASKNATQFLGLTRGHDGTTAAAHLIGTVAFEPLFPVSGELTIDAEVVTYYGMTLTSFTNVVRGIPSSSHLIGADAVLEFGEPVVGIEIQTIPTFNRNGNAGLAATATISAVGSVDGSLGPVELLGTASLKGPSADAPSAYVQRNAQATLTGTAYMAPISTGGTPVDTATAVLRGYGWISGIAKADFVGAATLSGNGTVLAADLTQIHNGSASLTAQATLTAVGSIS